MSLDWQIETDNIHERASELPELRRKRRRERTRLLFFLLGATLILGAAVGGIVLRLNEVDSQIQRALVETVQAEFAALRIGDFPTFISIQRSASETWLQAQRERFNQYQALKTAQGLELTGQIIEVTIDGLRGRVTFEEVLQGKSHRAVWFYWRFSEGWRHVPSDYTFWGDFAELSGPKFTLKYRALDADLAPLLAERLEAWLIEGCRIMGDAECAPITAEIVPNPVLIAGWDSEKPNTFYIPSPLARDERVPLDAPLPAPLEETIAVKIAEGLLVRLTGVRQENGQLNDATWLRQSFTDWAGAAFINRLDPLRHAFFQSMHTNYGDSATAAVARGLAYATDLSWIGNALGQPVTSLNLDWRPYFQWRLDTERQLVAQSNVGVLQQWWDIADPATYNALQNRLNNPTQPTGQVIAIGFAASTDGAPRMTVQVTIDGAPQNLSFVFRDGTWKRTAMP